MTGEEGIEDGDVEEEIRRELEALKDWEDEDIAKYETADLIPGSTNPTINKNIDDSTPDSVETYIRLLQLRNTKLEDGLLEVQDVLKPSNKPSENAFQKTDGDPDEEISEEMKEKVLIEIEEFESNAKINDQYAEENISSLEEMGFNNLKELEEKQHLKSDRLDNIFNELKEEEILRQQREEGIREENKRKADEEYKMKVEENQIIKQKLEEEAEVKQRQLKELEIMFEIEMKDLAKKQEEERLALQKIKNEEIKKQKMRKEKACITIQKNYRGYRVMLEHGKFLKIKRVERQERRQEELDALERKERELMEDAVRKAKEEEERHLKEVEMEKVRKEQEEERRRMEEVRKKREEEERRRKEEGERKRKEEEERKRKEEQEQKIKEEEEERKKREKEERKKMEEEEKKRKEEKERKNKEEDEKRKQEEEERKLLEEKKRFENEQKRAEEERRKREDEEKARRVQEHENKMNESQKNNEDKERNLEEDKEMNLNVGINHTNSFESNARSQNLTRTEILPDNRGITNKTLVAKNCEGLQKREMEDRNNETSSTREEKCDKSKTVVQEKLPLGISNDKLDIVSGKDDECCKSGDELSGLSSEMEIRRAEWLKRTVPWSSVSAEENQTTKSRSRSRRPLSAAQKLPSISEEEIAKSQNKFTFLEKVVHVNLKDLPARNLKIMLRCANVNSATVHNSGLLAAENFENCKHLKKLNLSDNCIQNINCQNIESLEELDLSKNQLTSVNGLDGCSNLRSLKLDGNKITRIGSFTSNKVMHLSLQNNQLITTKGLSQMKYMQILDCSNNFLNHVEQLESCLLLRIIRLRGNNLQKPPVLSNHVLLRELHLSENSITSLESLSNQWLPLLQHLYVDNNSLSSLSPLQAFPMLETLDIRNNLISDEENLIPGLVGCYQLRNIRVHGNPVCEDSNIKSVIFKALPSLGKLDDEIVGKNLLKDESMDTTIFRMCVAQIFAQDEMLARHIAETGNVQFESNDDNQIIERLKVQSRQFSELQDLIIKHRLQHENFQQLEQDNVSGVLTATTPETTHNITKLTGPTLLREKIVDVPPKLKEDATQNMLSKDVAALKEAQVDPALGIDGSQTCLEQEDNTSVFVRRRWNNTHHQAATRIQARYRGFRIRKRYLEATKSAHYRDIATGEEEEFNFDEEVDLSMFDVDEAALDSSWVPRSSGQLSPRNPAPFVAASPPVDPPPSAEEVEWEAGEEENNYRPFPPRHAWRSPNSPVSQYNPRRVIPPLDRTTEISEENSHSGNTTEMSHRTSELSSEWGFSKNATAELMLKRAKKMKYNALRKKKLNDPGKRFELFKKTEEANKVHGVQPIQTKKGKQRIDYFTGRDSRYQQPSAKSTPTPHQEEIAKKEMTFSWVYNQAVVHKDKGEEVLRDTKGYLTESIPVKNRHERSAPVSLPRMDPAILAGRHLHLVASPVGNPRPSPINTTDGDLRLYSKHSWNEEKTHSNPDLTRAGLNMVNETREKSNSADARITRERNNFFS